MPPLVRRFLKTAIVFLLVGIVLGLYMPARRDLAGIWATPWWTSAHTHAILVGFVMMMIAGVALCMFPAPPRTTPTSIGPPGAQKSLPTKRRMPRSIARSLGRAPGAIDQDGHKNGESVLFIGPLHRAAWFGVRPCCSPTRLPSPPSGNVWPTVVRRR